MPRYQRHNDHDSEAIIEEDELQNDDAIVDIEQPNISKNENSGLVQNEPANSPTVNVKDPKKKKSLKKKIKQRFYGSTKRNGKLYHFILSLSQILSFLWTFNLPFLYFVSLYFKFISMIWA